MHFSPLPERPDYTHLTSWAAHPAVPDPTDVMPPDIVSFDQTQPQVHGAGIPTFFVYPTVYLKGDRWNADIHDAAHREAVQSSTIKYQASVFSAIGEVWSPYYRQMIYRGYVPRRKDNLQHIDAAFDTAYADVVRAFERFISQIPEGPYILAGHSQGTHHAVHLLREVIAKDSALSGRLLVAFLVGGEVTAENTDGFPICEHPEDINCWVGWRTVSKRHNLRKAKDSDLLVNPMTMSLSHPVGTRDDYMGAFDGENRLENIGIRSFIDRGTVHIHGIRFPYNLRLNRRDYHRMDYNLFWFNIRHNLYVRQLSWTQQGLERSFALLLRPQGH